MSIQWLNDISLGKKLIGGFLVVSFITGLVGGIGFYRIFTNMAQVEDMVNKDVKFLKDAEELKIFALQHRRYEKDFLLNIGNNEKQKGYIKKFKGISKTTTTLIDTIIIAVGDDIHLSPAMKEAALNAQSTYSKYNSGFIGLTTTVMADDSITPQKANGLMKPFKSYIYTFEKSVDVLLQGAIEMVKAESDAILVAGKQSRLLIGVILGFGVLISISLGVILKEIITRPVNKAVIFANKMAQGDLTQSINVSQKDEIGTLVKSMNEMSLNLKTMLQEVIQGAQTLTSSSTELLTVSEEITANSEQTAKKSNTVATAVEEMSSSMSSVASATEQTSSNIQMVVTAADEMASTVQEIAGNTSKGSAITQSAVDNAKEVSNKVNELGKAAQEINKVTETIAEISEQTNLLALNATIEAARAGDAGKGFAVVANEIKELAKQTADATTEINSKIMGVQNTTADSVTSIEAIVTVINEINDIVITVATAIEEQSLTTREISNNVSQAGSGVQEINENINQISNITDEVTSNIAEVSIASEETNTGSRQVNESALELSKLAGNLNEMVKRFAI